MNEQKNISTPKNESIHNKAVSVIIAGGGTGGHIFPAVAIANAIKKINPQARFLFVGAKGKMEMEKVPQAGFEIVGIDIAGFNRSSLTKNIGLPFKLVKSFFQVKKIFKNFMPDVCIGVGGYSTFPVLRTAQAKGIPTFIHESNSFAGKSNILLGKKATKIFVASKGMEKFFPGEKIMITGNPVRNTIANNNLTSEFAKKFFGLNENKKTILSIGGSLGAQSINTALSQGMNAFSENDVQLIWQTGKSFFAEAKVLSGNQKNVFVSDFIKEMDYAYKAADVVISRAGAMAITELAIVGKASVLVPYPYAAEDHQTVNAQYYANHQAAIMVKDKEVNDQLITTIIGLLKDDEKRNTIENNVKKLAVQGADDIIAIEILKTIDV